MPAPVPTSTMLTARLGIRRDPDAGEDPFRFVLDVSPHVLVHGQIRRSVLALLVDMAAGWACEANVGEDWVFTSDLSVRAPLLATVPTRVFTSGTMLRSGRTSAAADVFLRDEHGAEVGYGIGGFVRQGRRPGDNPKPSTDGFDLRAAAVAPIDGPLHDVAGVAVTDAAHGVVEVALTDALRNPAGVMQGAMVAMVAEAAAEALLEHQSGVPHVVTDLDVRYLRKAAVGPVRSRAWTIGTPGTDGAAVRVCLHDTGAGDALTSVHLLRGHPVG